jgi:hypothetical protein
MKNVKNPVNRNKEEKMELKKEIHDCVFLERASYPLFVEEPIFSSLLEKETEESLLSNDPFEKESKQTFFSDVVFEKGKLTITIAASKNSCKWSH